MNEDGNDEGCVECVGPNGLFNDVIAFIRCNGGGNCLLLLIFILSIWI